MFSWQVAQVFSELSECVPIVTGITFVFTFHMHCISVLIPLYFRIFSASFFITILSPEIAIYISTHVITITIIIIIIYIETAFQNKLFKERYIGR